MRTLLTLAFWMVGPWSTLALAQSQHEVMVLPPTHTASTSQQTTLQSETEHALRVMGYEPVAHVGGPMARDDKNGWRSWRHHDTRHR